MNRSHRQQESGKQFSHSREFVILFVVIFGVLSILNSLRISDSTLRESTILIANEYSNAANLIVSTMILEKNSSSEGTRALLEEMVNTSGSRLLYVIIQAPSGKTLIRVGTVPKNDVVSIESAGKTFSGFRMTDRPVEITKNVLLPHNTVCSMKVGVIGPSVSMFDVFSQTVSFIMLIGLTLLYYSRSAKNQQETKTEPTLKEEIAPVGFTPRSVLEKDKGVVEVFGQSRGSKSG